MGKPQYKVTIKYKSGNEIVVWCDDITVKRIQLNGALEISWETMKPRPLLLGVDEIESVWLHNG